MKTILVIEDDPFIRESIQDVLELEGYKALTAPNGKVGVQMATEHLPDLILCDVCMPEMDGHGVLETLRCHPVTDTIPFIFLTARTTTADIRQGMNLGADDYVAKPCTANELLSAITSRLERQAIVQTKSEKQLTTLRNNIAQSLPHELYTPLNGILGFSELLWRDAETIDRGEIQEVANAIHVSALRLHRLMQNFLLYTKLELIAHHPEQIEQLQTQITYDAEQMAIMSAEQVAAEAERSEDLHCSEPAISSVNLCIAEAHLQKVVEELVDNAFKFSEPGTPVVLQQEQQDQAFCLSVSNQGRGMTADQIASLGAYMQFDRKYYEQQGSGLGLYIVKKISELYGGVFTIQSEPGKTTKVQVKFHLTQHPMAANLQPL